VYYNVQIRTRESPGLISFVVSLGLNISLSWSTKGVLVRVGKC
jgi:hypothetical protein